MSHQEQVPWVLVLRAASMAAGREGTRFPYWTWQRPDPQPLEQARP